jgi:hypothetical protein
MSDSFGVKRTIEALSHEWADQYQRENLRGPSEAKILLGNPLAGLNFILMNSFARAGGEQAGYGDIATQALKSALQTHGPYESLVQLDNAPDVVWRNFIQICDQQYIGANQKLNQGVIEGVVKLAQNSVNYNPFEHIGSRLMTDSIGAFLLLRNIHGIADKVAPFILRDIVTILDVENEIAPQDQILLQPMDRWLQGIARHLWNELGNRAPSWLIALKVIAECRRYGCSPARFNQGAWKYGSSKIIFTSRIPEGMKKLVQEMKNYK